MDACASRTRYGSAPRAPITLGALASAAIMLALLAAAPTPACAATLEAPTPLVAPIEGDFETMPTGAWRHDRDEQLHLDYADVFPNVGMVFSPIAFGSGTLVHPEWVVTAAHVVDDDFDDSDFGVLIDDVIYTVARREIHTEWDGNLGAGYDIALIQLETPVTGITPAVMNTNPDELDRVGTNVGFGVGGTGDEGFEDGTAGVKRAGDNMVDEFGGWAGWSDRVMLQDFDAPEGFEFDGPPGQTPNTTDWFGDEEPLDLEYIIGFGDSGGGLFIDFGDGPVLAGIHSFISHEDEDYYGMYGTIAGSVRMSQFHDWAIAVIPEPTTGTLLLLMAGTLALARPRRRAR